MEQVIEILKAVKNNDWKTMLKYFPEGVTHRTWTYNTPESFTDWEDYQDYVRYVAPARDMMIEKCLDKVIKLLEEK